MSKREATMKELLLAIAVSSLYSLHFMLYLPPGTSYTETLRKALYLKYVITDSKKEQYGVSKVGLDYLNRKFKGRWSVRIAKLDEEIDTFINEL